MKAYIEKILLPYVSRKRKESKLSPDNLALIIFDISLAKGQRESFGAPGRKPHVVMVPANCMDRLQPLDVSVNKPAKNFLWQQFHTWYAEQICQQLGEKASAHAHPD